MDEVGTAGERGGAQLADGADGILPARCIPRRRPEVFTGDIPTFEKTDIDRTHEHHLRDEWIDSLPAPYTAEVRRLFAEMDAMETEEAKIIKALDRMEAVITHNEGDPCTWLPLEYDLQHTYGVKEAAFSPILKNLRAEVNTEVDEVIASLAKEE